MNTKNIDNYIKILCDEANKSLKLLKVEKIYRRKWIVENNSCSEKEIFDILTTRVKVYSNIINKIKSLDIYKNIENYIEKDTVFIKARKRAGYDLTKNILDTTIINSIMFDDSVAYVDSKKAIDYIKKTRKFLNQRKIEYKAFARLLGVEIKSKRFKIKNNIIIQKLSEDEINSRQPYNDVHYLTSFQSDILLTNRVEIQATMKITFEKNFTKSDTNKIARENFESLFDDILNAFRILKGGDIDLEPIKIESFFGGIGRDKGEFLPIYNPSVCLKPEEEKQLKIIYDAFDNIHSNDSVLERAIHRYCLGRQRRDVLDRFLDYVIAWETILLTNNKNDIPGELSYRFRMNGASLLNKVIPKLSHIDGFKIMKNAYSIRSDIVHGRKRDKIKTNKFNEIFCKIDEYFRLAILWLIDLKVEDRPYNKQDGWEYLIWKC